MHDYKYAASLIKGYNLINAYEEFNTFSYVYKVTNEKLNLFQHMLTGSKALSVIGSGDEIIEMIKNGTTDITSFDISIFPKYYLFLKLAGIESLTKDEYIDFFLGEHNYDENDKSRELYFYKIRSELEGEYLKFWDYLLDKYEWSSIFHSKMFAEGKLDKNIIIDRISYLKQYDILKEKIKNVNISCEDEDIMHYYKKCQDEYDLVYLSNILDYVYYRDYKKMLKKLNLSESGKVLTYIFHNNSFLELKFKEKEYSLTDLKDSSHNSILTYKRW